MDFAAKSMSRNVIIEFCHEQIASYKDMKCNVLKTNININWY